MDRSGDSFGGCWWCVFLFIGMILDKSEERGEEYVSVIGQNCPLEATGLLGAAGILRQSSDTQLGP